MLSALRREKEASLYAPLVPTITAQTSIGAFGPQRSDLKNQEIYTVGLAWEIGLGGILDFGRMELQDAKERQGEIQLAQVYEEISQKVYDTHAQIKSLTTVIAHLRVAKEEAQKLLAINRERQEWGVATPLELVQAERDLTQARLNYLRAVTEYNKAQYRMYLMLGNSGK